MVSKKIVVIMIVIALLLLGSSLLISNINVDTSSKDLETESPEGNPEASINLEINPPAGGAAGAG